MCLWWAPPEWQTAFETWALFILTLIAVGVGGRAALSASRTYALEAEPVIIIRPKTFAESYSIDAESRLKLISPPLRLKATVRLPTKWVAQILFSR